MHPSLREIQPPLLQLPNQLLRLLLHALLGRDIDREPRLPLVVLLIHEAFFPLIQPQKYNLRDIQARVVLRNHILFGRVEDVLADDGLDVRVAHARQRRRRGHERLNVFEEDECCAGVAQGRGEKGVVGAEEGDAVQWRAFAITASVGCYCCPLCRVDWLGRVNITREVVRDFLAKLAAQHRVDGRVRGLGEVGLGKWGHNLSTVVVLRRNWGLEGQSTSKN